MPYFDAWRVFLSARTSLDASTYTPRASSQNVRGWPADSRLLRMHTVTHIPSQPGPWECKPAPPPPARRPPARRIDTTHTLLSSTYTLENVAAVGVVMNSREDSRHAMPCILCFRHGHTYEACMQTRKRWMKIGSEHKWRERQNCRVGRAREVNAMASVGRREGGIRTRARQQHSRFEGGGGASLSC